MPVSATYGYLLTKDRVAYLTKISFTVTLFNRLRKIYKSKQMNDAIQQQDSESIEIYEPDELLQQQ